jgi:Domain of unknown function (DUF1772)
MSEEPISGPTKRGGGRAGDALRLVNVLSASLAAGGQLVVLAAIVPVTNLWAPERSIELHRETLTQRPDRLLRPFTIASVASALLVLLTERKRPAESTAWLLGGLGGCAGVAVISEKFEFPINRMLLDLPSPDQVPEEYAAIRRRWNRGHAARTACGIIAAACFTMSAVTRGK